MENVIKKLFSHWSYPLIVLAVLGILLYGQTLFFDFTYLDDNTLILNNQVFLSSWQNIFSAFQTDVFHLFNHSASYYRPILTIVFMFGYHITGAAPFAYHLIALSLHILAVILSFIFFKKLGYKKTLSFFVALIFLVHPVLVQAVAWVPGLNDSLLAVFMLASFFNFFNFLEKNRQKYFWWSLLFFALAIFSKETALFSLPIFIYFAWMIKKDLGIFIRRKKIAVGFLAVTVVWFFLRHFALRNNAPLELGYALKSVFGNLAAIVQYAGKIFFPFNLSVLPIIQNTTFLWGILAMVVLSVLFFITKDKRWSFIFFGAAWFFIFLLPSFIRPNPNLVADFIEHRLYLPILGFFVVMLELEPLRRWREEKKNHIAIALAVILLFGFLTIFHSRDFSNRMAFWKQASQTSPDYPLSRRNLGAMYYLDGDLDAAQKEFEAALRLHPEEEMAHNNLGLIYMQKNELEKAEEEYKEEIAINPYYDDAYFNLGLLYYKKEQIESAEESWKKTLSINPTHTGALGALANLEYNRGNYKNAAMYVEVMARLGAPLPPQLSALLEPLTLMRLQNGN